MCKAPLDSYESGRAISPLSWDERDNTIQCDDPSCLARVEVFADACEDCGRVYSDAEWGLIADQIDTYLTDVNGFGPVALSDGSRTLCCGLATADCDCGVGTKSVTFDEAYDFMVDVDVLPYREVAGGRQPCESCTHFDSFSCAPLVAFLSEIVEFDGHPHPKWIEEHALDICSDFDDGDGELGATNKDPHTIPYLEEY